MILSTSTPAVPIDNVAAGATGVTESGFGTLLAAANGKAGTPISEQRPAIFVAVSDSSGAAIIDGAADPLVTAEPPVGIELGGEMVLPKGGEVADASAASEQVLSQTSQAPVPQIPATGNPSAGLVDANPSDGIVAPIVAEGVAAEMEAPSHSLAQKSSGEAALNPSVENDDAETMADTAVDGKADILSPSTHQLPQHQQAVVDVSPVSHPLAALPDVADTASMVSGEDVKAVAPAGEDVQAKPLGTEALASKNAGKAQQVEGAELPRISGEKTMAASVVLSQLAATDNVNSTADNGQSNGLPTSLLSQTIIPSSGRTAVNPYSTALPASPDAVVVQAVPGKVGNDIGVEIARAAKGDKEDLLIRLSPHEMGRVNVRLSFDKDGVVRAVVSADSPAALDMLRRESGDLSRALADAGIRSDAQSLRFDSRSGDQGQKQMQGQWAGQQEGRSQSGVEGQERGSLFSEDGAQESGGLHYHPIRTSSQIDMMA